MVPSGSTAASSSALGHGFMDLPISMVVSTITSIPSTGTEDRCRIEAIGPTEQGTPHTFRATKRVTDVVMS
jgi:hypothetical protein